MSNSGISLYQLLDKFRLIINTKLVGSSMFESSLSFLIPETLSGSVESIWINNSNHGY